jgi:hypothetical protein
VLEFIVALAPIKFLRNQRVDVGVDGEVTGGVEARPDRKHEADQDNERGKPRASLDNRYDNTCQHSFFFPRVMDLPRTPAIYRSSTTRSNVVLGGFLEHAGTRPKNAETAMKADIAADCRQ